MIRPSRIAHLGLLVQLAVPAASAIAQDVTEPAVYAAEPASAVSAPAAAVENEGTLAGQDRGPQSASASVGPSKGAASANRLIEEIVVTAQKREENLKDVPISVAAFSGEKLEALNISAAMDLPQITPGLQYDQLVGYSLVFIRGVGTEVFIPSAETAVATYLDGVYSPFASGLSQEFGKLERIEILKGPQGTLFGRNATGGALNIITAKPSRDLTGSFGAEYNEHYNGDGRKFKAYISGPLNDQVQMSFSALASTADNYLSRTDGSPRSDFNDERSHGAQVRVNWDVTDTLSWMVTGLVTRENGVGSTAFSSTDVKPLFKLVVPEENRPWRSDPDLPVRFRANNNMVYSHLNWQSPTFFDVKLLASHQDILTGLVVDFEGSPAPLVNFSPQDQGIKATTAELQLISNVNGWRPDQFQWTAGYYFYRGRDMGMRDLTLTVAESLTNPLAGDLLSAVNELVQKFTDAGLGVPPGIAVNLSGLVDSTAHALYAQGTYRFTEEFGLTLGARYQEEERKLTKSTIGLEYADGYDSLPLVPFGERTQNTNDVSPKVALDYKILDDSMIYASWQQAYRSGTFNSVNILKPPTEVDPEKISTYEIGLKGNAFGGILQYSIAGFQNTIDDLQVLFVSLQSSGAITIENAARSRTRGVDGDFVFLPFPELLPGLALTGAACILDGKFLSFPDATGYDEATGLYEKFDATGNTATRSPDYTYSFGFNYLHEFDVSTIETNVNVYHNSGYFFDARNSVEQPAYTLLNASISYGYTPLSTRLTVFGQNLTNEARYSNRFETDFNIASTWAPPRIVGVRVEYQF